MPRKILITDALPYANGPLHIGHIVGAVQADIWARFFRMNGHACYYVCGSDTHGTPIMVNAHKQGKTPEELVNEVVAGHAQDFADFHVKFDSYHSTHHSENKKIVDEIYLALKANGDIESREIEQAFDEEKQMFLPDRYVKGACPKCKTADQHGDSCETCGATYSPTDLIDPVSILSGKPPITKTSEHFFFKLNNYKGMLENWIKNNHTQEEVKHKLLEWFKEDLKDWDISRDDPYFGFEIPGAPGKYFYVWLDAPIGYLASFEKFCEKTPDVNFDEFWRDESTELYHIVGKDIIYFHALFWPAVLHGAGFRKPSFVSTHGFLTINGKKMSKSRGTFIKARTYLDHLNPEYFRYYCAAKLSTAIDDIDWNLEDFRLRVNSDIVGKVVNIASRCAGFIRKKFDNVLADTIMDEELFTKFTTASTMIAELYEQREFSKAIREIMTLADLANQFIEQYKPWELAKDENKLPLVAQVCSQGINLFKILMVYLKPIIPTIAEKVEEFLNIEPLTWQDSQKALLNHKINKFKPLITRIEEEQIKGLF